MKPRLLNLAAGVSLLLAVAIAVLWVRSNGRHESISRNWHTSTEDRSWTVHSLYGALNVMVSRYPDIAPPIAPSYAYADYSQIESKNLLFERHWFPFPPVQFAHLGPYDIRELIIAYWLLLLPTLPLPILAFARHRRRRQRETNNRCPTCGYDLRATPDRCPECGLRPAPVRV